MKVQKIAGTAKLKIYSVGRINLLNKNSKKNKVLKIIKQINPDVIRSYNALLEGWIGAKCSQEYNIPFFVSLHVQYDTKRKFEKHRNYKKYLALKYYRKTIEPFVLKIADKITIVYKIIEPYVIEMCQKKPEILYNKINDLIDYGDVKLIVYNNKPIKSAVNITLMDYNIQKNSYIEIRI